jgi:hypothetical protein
MSEVTFAVLDVAPEPYAVTPILMARVGIAADGDDPIHAIALRCQVRIDPMRRSYSDDEAAGLLDLFGPRERWGRTQHTFLWLHTTAMVQGITGTAQVNLPLECTYDFGRGGQVHACTGRRQHPLQFLFSGTVSPRPGLRRPAVPWDREERYDMPVSVWRDLMQQHFRTPGGCGWTATPSTRWPCIDRCGACSGSMTRSPRCWRTSRPGRSHEP